MPDLRCRIWGGPRDTQPHASYSSMAQFNLYALWVSFSINPFSPKHISYSYISELQELQMYFFKTQTIVNTVFVLQRFILPQDTVWWLMTRFKISLFTHNSIKDVKSLSPTLCNPMDCSLWGSSIHGIFQARVLEWVAISFSRRSSSPRDWTQVSRIASRCFHHLSTREAHQRWKTNKTKVTLHSVTVGCMCLNKMQPFLFLSQS